MSTQTESPINGNHCEIIKDINHLDKISATMDCVQKLGELCNGTDLTATDISGSFMLGTKKCQQDEENDTCIAKVFDIVKENGTVNDMHTENKNNRVTADNVDESNTNTDEIFAKHDDNSGLKQSELGDNKAEVEVEKKSINEVVNNTTASETTEDMTTSDDSNIQNGLSSHDKLVLDEQIDKLSGDVENGDEISVLEKETESDVLTTVNLQSSDNALEMEQKSETGDTRVDETLKESTPSASTEESYSPPVDGSSDVEMIEQANVELSSNQDHKEPELVSKHDIRGETQTDFAESAEELQTNEITEIELITSEQDPEIKPTETKIEKLEKSNELDKSTATNTESDSINESIQSNVDLESEATSNTLQKNDDCVVNTVEDIKDKKKCDKTSESISMETDTDIVNLESENSMETDDTGIINKIDEFLEKNLESSYIRSVDKDSIETHDTGNIDKIDESLEKNLESSSISSVDIDKAKQHKLENDNLMKIDKSELMNSETINHISTENKQELSTSVLDCNDSTVVNLTETKKSGEDVVIDVELEKKESDENVAFYKVDDTKDIEHVTPIKFTDNSEPNQIEKSIEESEVKEDIADEDDVSIVEKVDRQEHAKKNSETPELKSLTGFCKLSNTLDILSDDEEEATKNEVKNITTSSPENKTCINIDEDDDIMLIEEEESTAKESISNQINSNSTEKLKTIDSIDLETGENQATNITDLMPKSTDKEPVFEQAPTIQLEVKPKDDVIPEETNKTEDTKPLLPHSFLNTAKKNLASMTRHELEDFCILRIVESIVDRSNLSDIKTKMKTMAQNIEEYKKKALLLIKQNRDLQVVVKSIQEEQKKKTNEPIQPLKITRSVGMQVVLNDNLDPRRKMPIPTPTPSTNVASSTRPVRAAALPKQPKPPGTPPNNIPVPRKVPVNNSPAKTLSNASANAVANKSATPSPVAMRNLSPVQKVPEKRTHSQMAQSQASCPLTVDLTDDEPPAKMNNKKATPPVRVVPAHNLVAQNRQHGNATQPLNTPRKVYIPISGPQSIRAGQTLMVKNVIAPGTRQRLPSPRAQTVLRPKQFLRHPAPLPDAMKQYTPPTWKNLPPAPDLKLSKVENGIVISWKIDGHPEGDYEPIASYQLYAYQETNAPPNTALWKKIGDVKALPLPMACTLTQFMAGYKYYFAVRAVDIRSRLGPFSLPGNIVLLNPI